MEISTGYALLWLDANANIELNTWYPKQQHKSHRPYIIDHLTDLRPYLNSNWICPQSNQYMGTTILQAEENGMNICD